VTAPEYFLRRTQWFPDPLGRVFPFFERPENLAVITPPDLAFRIRTPGPLEMKEGALIDYSIRVAGVPMRWRSRISEYDPPRGFVDSQVVGPYRFWIHAHRFREENGGTTVSDEIRYALPFGPFGRAAHAVFVRRQLEGIFDYRREALERIRASGWKSA
jgi:ligand-binding SRPBCC domain-containing protein